MKQKIEALVLLIAFNRPDTTKIAFVHLYYGLKVFGINVFDYLRKVVVKTSVLLILTTIFALIPLVLTEPGILRLMTISFISISTSLIAIRYLGLTEFEYGKIRGA